MRGISFDHEDLCHGTILAQSGWGRTDSAILVLTRLHEKSRARLPSGPAQGHEDSSDLEDELQSVLNLPVAALA